MDVVGQLICETVGLFPDDENSFATWKRDVYLPTYFSDAIWGIEIYASTVRRKYVLARQSPNPKILFRRTHSTVTTVRPAVAT